MLLNQIFGLVEYIAAKETEGGTLTVPNRNLLLNEINVSLFREEWGKVEKMRTSSVFMEILAQSPLVRFMEKSDLAPNNATGIADLTGIDPYEYIISLSPHTDLRDIELITIAEADKRRNSIMFQSPDIRPYAFITGHNLTVIPYDIGDLWVDYVRLPVTPYYDSCQDNVNYKDVYMPEGSYIALVGGLNVLYDENDAVLNANVTKADMTFLPFPSRTVELEWQDSYHVMFIGKILSRMGLNLSLLQITQYGEQMNSAK